MAFAEFCALLCLFAALKDVQPISESRPRQWADCSGPFYKTFSKERVIPPTELADTSGPHYLF
jgi:hypothetical protein